VGIKHMGYVLDSSGSRKGPVADSCEHSNEPPSSIPVSGVQFPDQLSEYQLLKKDSTHTVNYLVIISVLI
jgi:hypothetical protein